MQNISGLFGATYRISHNEAQCYQIAQDSQQLENKWLIVSSSEPHNGQQQALDGIIFLLASSTLAGILLQTKISIFGGAYPAQTYLLYLTFG